MDFNRIGLEKPWFLLVGVLLIAAQANAALAPGDHEFTVSHGGLARSYLVHMPPRAAGAALPVVINFHGAGSNARTQKWYSRMDRTADREGFIAVYPNGTGVFSDRLLTWNAGNCCGFAALSRVDDVGFALAVIDDLARRTPIDQERIYATGLSNGSMMAYRLAAEASERIAAVAGVAGAMAVPDFAPRVPVPVMHIHSIDDHLALYGGGLGRLLPALDTRIFHPSVSTMLARWLKHDGCSERGEAAEPIAGTGPDEGHSATRFVWRPCRDGVEIVLWRLQGAGHVWPGGRRDFMSALLGPSTAVIDANREIWEFFRRFRRKTGAPSGTVIPQAAASIVNAEQIVIGARSSSVPSGRPVLLEQPDYLRSASALRRNGLRSFSSSA